jgi:hypothetical protein
MSTKHTPEPWQAHAFEVYDQRNLIIADCGYSEHEFTVEGCKANADRIVACVNAMSGIPDPAAFMEKLRGSNMVFFEAVELEEKLNLALRHNVEHTSRILQLINDRDQLIQWKHEAIALLDEITEFTDQRPDIPLGASRVEFTIGKARESDVLAKRLEQIESLVSTFTEHHLNAIGEAAYTAFWFKFNEITGTNAGGGGA